MDCAKSIMCRLCAQGAHFVQEVPRRCPLVQIGLLEAQDSANAWWSLNTSHTAPDTLLTHYSRTTLTLLIHYAWHTGLNTGLNTGLTLQIARAAHCEHSPHCSWHNCVQWSKVQSFALYKLHTIVCQSLSDCLCCTLYKLQTDMAWGITHWSAWMKRYWSSMMMIQNSNGDNDAYVMSNENSEETKCVHFNNWVIVRAGNPWFQFCECVSFDWSVNFTRKRMMW